ncbi:response regulator transcription factor [Mycetocola saprophilus]|uniref:response regulator transcription factor n=1 Tax=Mycetocola saprophilus TaxID=76636 RepID=UPI000ABA30AB|nr:response regulator transcription factor [Mycetocola saprophilus]
MAELLIAEDDPAQAELIRLYAQNEGHHVTVVPDGRAALDEVRRKTPDLLILDVMMPRLDGLDVCRILRAESAVPILMVTAKTSEDDLLLGLDLGADDYLTKPYSPRELMARVRALLRRDARGTVTPVIRVGALEIDPGRHEARLGGTVLDLTPGEFAFLAQLAQAPGQVFTREQLIRNLHGVDRYISRRTIDVHVSNVRKKVEQNPAHPLLIRTIYGVGYKLLDPDA